MISTYALKLVEAMDADLLTLELDDLVIGSAEAAAGIVFSEDDLVAIYVYFNGIGACDIHLLAHFLRYYYSAELVDVSDYSGRFHFDDSFLFDISILSQRSELCQVLFSKNRAYFLKSFL